MTGEHLNKLKLMVEEVESFSKKQIMEAIYWMVLGDGHIEHGNESRNCSISISHKKEYEDYITWKGFILDRVTGCSIRDHHVNGGFNGPHDMIRLRSKAHPWINKVWERLYAPIGRKAIDSMALSLLSPLGLAILYQDDGSYHYSTKAGNNVLIHKLCFSKFELEALAKVVVDKFGIILRINRDKSKGYGYRLRMRAKDIDKFFDLIMPYVVPSMFYKVERGGNQAKAA